MKVEGRAKEVLVRAKSLAEAKTSLVDGESLTAEEMEDALAEGLKVWKAGDPLPADEVGAEQDPKDTVAL
jgi:hypothetical protein